LLRGGRMDIKTSHRLFPTLRCSKADHGLSSM